MKNQLNNLEDVVNDMALSMVKMTEKMERQDIKIGRLEDELESHYRLLKELQNPEY